MEQAERIAAENNIACGEQSLIVKFIAAASGSSLFQTTARARHRIFVTQMFAFHAGYERVQHE
jgi:hypothetical protein